MSTPPNSEDRPRGTRSADVARLQHELQEALQAKDLAEHDRDQFEESWNQQREQLIRLRAQLSKTQQAQPDEEAP